MTERAQQGRDQRVEAGRARSGVVEVKVEVYDEVVEAGATDQLV